MDAIINQIYWLLNPLVLGFLLDSLIGDPYWLPHPIRLFGRMISFGENHLNQGRNRVLKGGILTITLTGIVYIILVTGFSQISNYSFANLLIESIFVFYGLANRSLISECLKVENAIQRKGLSEARKQLSTIVGRDTDTLSESQIRIATLETLSENLSDGVIAPLFYYIIGGVPLMFAYKMINTLDSMIGYKNERFLKFGKIAAKTDDVLNFIPARITAILMVFVSFNWRGLIYIFRYGRNHSSPNAGYPEAALAGILHCRFGGANYYQGTLVEKPFIGKEEKILTTKDVYKACIINVLVVLVSIICCFFI